MNLEGERHEEVWKNSVWHRVGVDLSDRTVLDCPGQRRNSVHDQSDMPGRGFFGAGSDFSQAKSDSLHLSQWHQEADTD